MGKKKLWDLANLKIGTTRKDDDGIDSPPPTPKSVVPPLSPRVDYDLRTACALVLQDFKPSDYVYHERFGDADDDDDPHLDRKTQLNYAAFMQALEDGGDDTEGPLDPVNTRQPDFKTEDDYRTMQPVPSLPKVERKSAASQQYTDGLWKRVRGEEDEVTEAPKPPSRPAPSKPPLIKRPVAHKRSASQPNQITGSTWAEEDVDRPKPARANSTRTAGSDGTDHILAASTAPTTAAITPAQRVSAGLWKSKDTDINELDGDWMRRELERHKQDQDAENARQVSEKHLRDKSIALSLATTNTADVISPIVHDAQTMQLQRAASTAVKVPARKPVPRTSVDGGPGTVLHLPPENATNADVRRSTSRKRKSTPRSESRAELEILESARQSREQSRPSRPIETDSPAPVTRTLPRNTGVRAPAPSANVSKAPSRSRSITRQIREFVRRPSLGSRQPSGDASRPESRGKQSMESLRSALTSNSWTENSSSKWKSWRPFQRNQDSTSSVDVAVDDYRGRNAASETTPAKTKPPINLNRELPPLPSLDQWKDEEPEPEPEPPIPSAQALYNPIHSNYSTTSPPNQSRSQSASVDSTKSAPRARDSVLNEILPPLRIHPKRVSSLKATTDAPKFHAPERLPDMDNIPASPDAVLTDTTTTTQQTNPANLAEIIRRASAIKKPTSTTRTDKHMPKNALPRHVADFSSPGVRRVQSTSTAPATRSQPLSSNPVRASMDYPSPTVTNGNSVSMDQTRSFTDPYHHHQSQSQFQPPQREQGHKLNFSRKFSTDIARDEVVVDDGRFAPSRAAPAVPPKASRDAAAEKEVVGSGNGSAESFDGVGGGGLQAKERKRKWWLPGKPSPSSPGSEKTAPAGTGKRSLSRRLRS